MNQPSNMSQRQTPLYERYAQDPGCAQIVDYAITHSNTVPASDPLHCEVEMTHRRDASLGVGVHHAVGGDSDMPTPGDILCAALASCLDSTIRIIANRLGIELRSLTVEVKGNVDVRGTLRAIDDCPVGFQSFEANVELELAAGVDPNLAQQMIKAAEYSCVVLQTLRSTPEVALNTHIATEQQTAKEESACA